MALVEFLRRSARQMPSCAAMFGQRKDRADVNTTNADVSVTDRSQRPAAATTAFPLGPGSALPPPGLVRTVTHRRHRRHRYSVPAAAGCSPHQCCSLMRLCIWRWRRYQEHIVASRCCYTAVVYTYSIEASDLYLSHFLHDLYNMTCTHGVYEYLALIVHTLCAVTHRQSISKHTYPFVSLYKISASDRTWRCFGLWIEAVSLLAIFRHQAV